MARVGGSRAVESFLRNFEGERQRYQEVLEVALCYGVFCLAQNFSLQGITVEELKAVTRYDAVRKRDYHVNKGGARASGGRKAPSTPAPPSATTETSGVQPRLLRAKPSHAWRDGATKAVDDEFASHLPANALDRSDEAAATTPALPASVASLLEPSREAPTAVDDVDFHSRLLGKPFVDTAWAVFTGRSGSQVTTRDALDALYVRVDQRKMPSAFPPTELPVASFAEFLNAYVATCVSQFQHKGAFVPEDEPDEDLRSLQGERGDSKRRSETAVRSTAEPGETRVRDHPRRRTVGTDTPAEVAARRIARTKPDKKAPQAQPKYVPKSLQHVRSKIQPELSARRDKVLRVKKTQTQLMKESLARARLAEYEARRHLEDARDRTMFKKKTPLSDIPQGAAALEIVDNFVRSPLMDTFGKNGAAATVHVTQAIGKQNDPVHDELYGAAPVDDSFIGCKVPKQRQPADRPKRGYNGWLGDFGPIHTKTVRHEWSDNDDDDDERDRPRDASKFEWNFDNFTKESNDRLDRSPTSESARDRPKDFLGRSARSDVDVDEGDASLNDNLSDSSNSVYQWLKEAV